MADYATRDAVDPMGSGYERALKRWRDRTVLSVVFSDVSFKFYVDLGGIKG